MPKCVSTFFIGLLITSCCSAQLKDTTANATRLPNEWMIKFAPLSIAESDGGLSFSLEYLIARQRIGYQIEVQPIFFSLDGDGGNSKLNEPRDLIASGPIHGIKLRPEIRYYLKAPQHSLPLLSNSRRLRTRLYLAAAFLYKQVQQQRVNDFYISYSGTQPGFRQQAEYTDIKRVAALEFKLGVLRPISKNHWFADVYFGAGVRFKKIFYRNIPSGALEPSRGGFWLGGLPTESETIPSLPFGIRITYRL